MVVWHSVLALLLASVTPGAVHGITEYPDTCKNVNNAADLVSALGSSGPLQLCLQQCAFPTPALRALTIMLWLRMHGTHRP